MVKKRLENKTDVRKRRAKA